MEGSNMHPSRVFDFNALDQSIGFRVQNGADLSRQPSFKPKSSPQIVASVPLPFGAFSKPLTSTNNGQGARVGSLTLPQQKEQPPNLVPLSSDHLENWGESAMADVSPRTDTSTDEDTEEKNQRFEQGQLAAIAASDSSDRTKDKTDQKTLRRLAQNREAARKSRLRKKVYVQQLESSRLKLSQLEQELQRARQQVLPRSGEAPSV